MKINIENFVLGYHNLRPKCLRIFLDRKKYESYNSKFIRDYILKKMDFDLDRPMKIERKDKVIITQYGKRSVWEAN